MADETAADSSALPELALDGVEAAPPPKITTPRELRPSASDLSTGADKIVVGEDGKVRRRRRVSRSSKDQSARPSRTTEELAPVTAEEGSHRVSQVAGDAESLEPAEGGTTAAPKLRRRRSSKDSSKKESLADALAAPQTLDTVSECSAAAEEQALEPPTMTDIPAQETIQADEDVPTQAEAAQESLEAAAQPDAAAVQEPVEALQEQEAQDPEQAELDAAQSSPELATQDAAQELGAEASEFLTAANGVPEEQDDADAAADPVSNEAESEAVPPELKPEASGELISAEDQAAPFDAEQEADQPAASAELSFAAADEVEPAADQDQGTADAAEQEEEDSPASSAESEVVQQPAVEVLQTEPRADASVKVSAAPAGAQKVGGSRLQQPAAAPGSFNNAATATAKPGDSAAVVRGAAMHARTRRMSDSDMAKGKKRKPLVKQLQSQASIPGAHGTGHVRAALERHGFKHVAEQLNEQIKKALPKYESSAKGFEEEAAAEAAAEAEAALVAEQEAAAEAEAADVATKTAQMIEDGTGEGLEHMEGGYVRAARRKAAPRAAAAVMQQAETAGSDMEEAFTTFQDEPADADPLREAAQEEAAEETEADIMQRTLDEGIIGLQAVPGDEEGLEAPDLMEKWSMSQRISELESQVMLLKLERDRTATALTKRFDTRVPVQKLLQQLQAELGLSQQTNGELSETGRSSASKQASMRGKQGEAGSPTIKAANANGNELASTAMGASLFKPKMSLQQRKHLETIREVKRQEDERTKAELAEAMAAIDLLMNECKGASARRASLESQARQLKGQVGFLLRKSDNDDALIAALRGVLPEDVQAELLAGRSQSISVEPGTPLRLSGTGSSAAVHAAPKRWVR